MPNEQPKRKKLELTEPKTGDESQNDRIRVLLLLLGRKSGQNGAVF
jgi:hypothetical protein